MSMARWIDMVAAESELTKRQDMFVSRFVLKYR